MTRPRARRLALLGGALALLLGCGPTPLEVTTPRGGADPTRHRLPVVRLMVSADGQTLGTADGEALHLWRLPALTLAARVEGIEGLDFAARVVLSPHGQQVAAWTHSQTLWLWPDLQGRAAPFEPLDRTPQHLIGFDGRGALLWVDTQGDVLRGARDPQRLGSLRAPPLYVSGDVARGFLLWGFEPASLRCRPAPSPDAPQDADAHTDADPDAHTDAHTGPDAVPCVLIKLDPFWGRWQPDAAPLAAPDQGLLLAPRGPEVMPLDLSLGRMEAPLSPPRAAPHARLCALALSPDGQWLVTATTDAPRLLWWSLSTRAVARVTALPPDLADPLWPQTILDAAFSDPHTLWVLLPEQRLLRYDAATGQRTGAWTL